MKIPQANPGAFVFAHRNEIDTAMSRVLDSGCYILGPEVAAFEQEFATFLGHSHAVAVASGTDALWLALRTLDLKPGAEVITVAMTAVATVAAIVEAGARPVFVDVCADDLTMDPASLTAAITPRTAAVIPVHLYGQPARLPEICAIADKAGVPVIEDCAQAHGASCDGRGVGTWGRLAAFSFYPTKNLGGLGDGGAIVTGDKKLVIRLRSLREYGWAQRAVSTAHGWNSRLDELQAAILRVSLQYLTAGNCRRQSIATTYTSALADTDIAVPPVYADRMSVYHQYVIRHCQRDQLRTKLAQHAVGTNVHYPVPVHLQEPYRDYGRGLGSLPVTERAADEVLSLPIYPELRDGEINATIRAIHESLSKCRH
ncbi:MAG: DegT/DnrJ/EryC1/StrS family aminotransferase [Verrucomicrobiota bacterium]|jgi:dTDP-4-amino-4,6-dideoxygalactose transaminase